MHKTRREPSAFNPEKVLAMGAQKKPSKASVQRMMSLCCVVAMNHAIKKTLYGDLQKERPDLFSDGAIIGSDENLEFTEGFLRRACAKRKLTFSDEVFAALFLAFLRD
jgi:hypothetical protein